MSVCNAVIGGGGGGGEIGGEGRHSLFWPYVPLNRVSFSDGIVDLLEISLTVNSSQGPR